jgi:hypothetical protein
MIGRGQCGVWIQNSDPRKFQTPFTAVTLHHKRLTIDQIAEVHSLPERGLLLRDEVVVADDVVDFQLLRVGLAELNCSD